MCRIAGKCAGFRAKPVEISGHLPHEGCNLCAVDAIPAWVDFHRLAAPLSIIAIIAETGVSAVYRGVG
jgi:hypothetical protein